ncbi:MAG TPA: hypothetical protein DIW30_06560 [Bacteroidales bacterium]|nr:hypothetical protein [Bacteroidales bacterium]
MFRNILLIYVIGMAVKHLAGQKTHIVLEQPVTDSTFWNTFIYTHLTFLYLHDIIPVLETADADN